MKISEKENKFWKLKSISMLLEPPITTSNDCLFSWPIIYKDTLKSFHKNYNSVWDNKAHLLIAKMYLAIIASNG